MHRSEVLVDPLLIILYLQTEKNKSLDSYGQIYTTHTTSEWTADFWYFQNSRAKRRFLLFSQHQIQEQIFATLGTLEQWAESCYSQKFWVNRRFLLLPKLRNKRRFLLFWTSQSWQQIFFSESPKTAQSANSTTLKVTFKKLSINVKNCNTEGKRDQFILTLW